MAGDTALTGGGLVAVVSPGGVAGTVPEDKLDDALKMGYRLEHPAEHTERRLEATYGDRPIAAAGLGAASALTFGGSDVILGGIAGAGGGENAIQEISARNPTARLVGEGVGMLTGAGAAGLISKAGAGAAARVGGGAIGRAVTTGATEGALYGVQQTISDSALSKDPLTAESVAGDLARNVLMGGGMGAAGGALGELVGKAAGKARQGLEKMGDDLARAAEPGEAIKLGTERKLELERLEAAAKPQREALVEGLKGLRADQKPFREALATRIASAPEAVRKDLQKAERSLAGVMGNTRRMAEKPSVALDAVTAYKQHLSDALGAEPPEMGTQMLDRVQALQTQLEKEAAGITSPKLKQIDDRLAEIKKAGKAPKEKSLAGELLGGAVKTAAQGALFAGAGAAADAIDLPGAGMLAFFLAGKLGGKLGEAVGGKLQVRAAEVGARVARAAGRVAGVVEKGAPAALARAGALAPRAFEDIRSSVLEAAADPQALEARIDQQLDGVRLHDPELANQLKETQMRGALHLAQVAPKSPGSPTLGDQSAPVSRLERDRFMRRAEVVMDPTSLLDSLEEGTLTPAQVETGDAVYPEIMTALRGRLIQHMAGKPISPERRLALSILLGAPATPSLRPENIAAMQQRHSADMMAAARVPPYPGSPPKPPPQPGRQPQPEEMTRTQRLAGR